MKNFSVKNANLNEQVNKKRIALLGVLYFIALIWIVVFKCNFNDSLNLEVNRARTIVERIKHGFSYSLFQLSYLKITDGEFLELFISIFNLFGFIPLGIVSGFFYKIPRAFLSSVAVVAGIEIFQLFTGYGGFEPTDVIVNTAGALIGIILCKALVPKIVPARINKIASSLLWLAIPFDVFCIVNTIIHFPG